jgi:hypothetical protein
MLCTGIRFCRRRSIKRPNNVEPGAEKGEKNGYESFWRESRKEEVIVRKVGLHGDLKWKLNLKLIRCKNYDYLSCFFADTDQKKSCENSGSVSKLNLTAECYINKNENVVYLILGSLKPSVITLWEWDSTAATCRSDKRLYVSCCLCCGWVYWFCHGSTTQWTKVS